MQQQFFATNGSQGQKFETRRWYLDDDRIARRPHEVLSLRFLTSATHSSNPPCRNPSSSRMCPLPRTRGLESNEFFWLKCAYEGGGAGEWSGFRGPLLHSNSSTERCLWMCNWRLDWSRFLGGITRGNDVGFGAVRIGKVWGRREMQHLFAKTSYTWARAIISPPVMWKVENIRSNSQILKRGGGSSMHTCSNRTLGQIDPCKRVWNFKKYKSKMEHLNWI